MLTIRAPLTSSDIFSTIFSTDETVSTFRDRITHFADYEPRQYEVHNLSTPLLLLLLSQDIQKQ